MMTPKPQPRGLALLIALFVVTFFLTIHAGNPVSGVLAALAGSLLILEVAAKGAVLARGIVWMAAALLPSVDRNEWRETWRGDISGDQPGERVISSAIDIALSAPRMALRRWVALFRLAVDITARVDERDWPWWRCVCTTAGIVLGFGAVLWGLDAAAGVEVPQAQLSAALVLLMVLISRPRLTVRSAVTPILALMPVCLAWLPNGTWEVAMAWGAIPVVAVAFLRPRRFKKSMLIGVVVAAPLVGYAGTSNWASLTGSDMGAHLIAAATLTGLFALFGNAILLSGVLISGIRVGRWFNAGAVGLWAFGMVVNLECAQPATALYDGVASHHDLLARWVIYVLIAVVFVVVGGAGSLSRIVRQESPRALSQSS